MFKSKMILRLTGLLVASVALTALGVQPLKAQTLQFATAFPETDFSSQLVKR